MNTAPDQLQVFSGFRQFKPTISHFSTWGKTTTSNETATNPVINNFSSSADNTACFFQHEPSLTMG